MNVPEGYVIYYVPANTSARCYLSRINRLDVPKFSFGLNKAEIFYIDIAAHDMKKAVERKLHDDGRDDIANALKIGTVLVSEYDLT